MANKKTRSSLFPYKIVFYFNDKPRYKWELTEYGFNAKDISNSFEIIFERFKKEIKKDGK